MTEQEVKNKVTAIGMMAGMFDKIPESKQQRILGYVEGISAVEQLEKEAEKKM